MSTQQPTTDGGAVLIVDDDPGTRTGLRGILQKEGLSVSCAETLKQGQALLEQSEPDVLIVDLRLPDGNGMTLVEHARATMPHVPVFVITGNADAESAIIALRQGVFDYIRKPLVVEDFLLSVHRALEYRTVSRTNTRLRDTLAAHDPSRELMGDSTAIQTVRRQIRQVSRTNTSVLITGESGTGKELAARAIHQLSKRSEGPWVPVSMSAIPETLLESELFGYVRGAFTGATHDKPGLMTLAQKGTLFLDEIGEMPLGLQSKLLRVLQERSVRPLGAKQDVPIDIRLLSATHRDLKQDAEAGSFREDLLFRVRVVVLHIPPLRERTEDIIPLTHHFLEKYCPEDRSVPQLSADVARTLLDYTWPGNVRELENVVQHALALSEGNRLERTCLPEEMTAPDREATTRKELSPYREARHQWEASYFQDLLEHTGGNIAAAARCAGISRRHVYDKLEALHVTYDPDEKSTT